MVQKIRSLTRGHGHPTSVAPPHPAGQRHLDGLGVLHHYQSCGELLGVNISRAILVKIEAQSKLKLKDLQGEMIAFLRLARPAFIAEIVPGRAELGIQKLLA